MQNPISIRLSKSANEIMPDDITKERTPLDPSAIIGGKHYGFIIFNEMTLSKYLSYAMQNISDWYRKWCCKSNGRRKI